MHTYRTLFLEATQLKMAAPANSNSKSQKKKWLKLFFFYDTALKLGAVEAINHSQLLLQMLLVVQESNNFLFYFTINLVCLLAKYFINHMEDFIINLQKEITVIHIYN